MTHLPSIASGPRETEAALLAALRRLHQEARREPALLARPVRVVVPSRSLRMHLASLLVREHGAVAGVVLQTLQGLAFEVLRAAGVPSSGGELVFPMLVRRAARQEPVLREALDTLEDGYGCVVATLSDLLDAGFVPELAEPLVECLEAEAAGEELHRALALVRAARRSVADLDALGLEHRSALFRRAAEALRAEPARLRARATLIHGFAEVTGVQGDLLEALVQQCGAEVWLDHPEDPAEPGRAAPGATVFTQRLCERLGGEGERLAPRAAPAERVLLRAPGAQAEVRAVAERIRTALAAGIEPERIGVVARDLAPYRLAVATQLRRLGIPFSGGEGFLRPEARRVLALLTVLERGEACVADRWLDALDRFGGEELADLRLALHSMGVGRLGDVVHLDLPGLLGGKGFFELPARRSLVARGDSKGGEEEEPEGGTQEPRAAGLPRRRVPRGLLESLERAAGHSVEALRRLRAVTHLGGLLEALRGLVTRGLGWDPQAPGSREVLAALSLLEAELSASLPLDFEEGRILVSARLRERTRSPLGGAGGGVQLQSVAEARGRSFERLFVLGMNREVFPRVVREDPLLSDALRGRMSSVLADLPIKQRGYEEERYLFAQLAAAAPQVVFSWQEVNDDGKERPVSPLVDRLCLGRGLAPEVAPPLLAARSAAPRPLHEHLVRAGLLESRSTLAELLALAPGMDASAAARVAALEEIDPRDARRTDLGPSFGLVGPPGGDDPRLADLYVTRLEGLARCPWKTFLARALGIEALPDSLAELPELSGLLVGNVVHRVLEAVASEAAVPSHVSLEEALAHGPTRVPWPEAARLDEILREASRATAREEGVALRGFASMLAHQAAPLVDRLRELDWPGGVRDDVLGVEIEGQVSIGLPGLGRHALRFRADRVDALADGVVFTDYKTGRKPISAAKRESTRRKHLLEQVSRGMRLQVPAYALASPGGAGRGRYLFAGPDLEADVAQVVIERGDDEVRTRFEAASERLLAAWLQGGLVPRLLDWQKGDEPADCARCELAAACVRGDSGSRRRLEQWLAASAEDPDRLTPVERSARSVLTLGEAAE